jgi:MoaA/NifB/PqqE/SkfB family radical SAM enzyme
MHRMSKSAAAPPFLERAAGVGRQARSLLELGHRRVRGRASPFQMTLSLTNRCNFRCEYCDIPGQHREEMSAAEWCAAIDDLAAGGMGRASLIGGEPLLRKDAGDIIRHLKRRGVHVAMNTNGWFVPERADDVRLLDLVCLTLDGPPAVHDTQRHPRSYEKVMRAMDTLFEHGVPFVTMTVLTPRGADNVDHVLEVAQRHGFRAFFQLEHDKNCDVMLPIAPRLGDDRIRALAQGLLDKKRAGAPVGNSESILRRHIDHGRYLGGCDDCFAGRYYGYVLSDGTVAPCLLTQWQVERGNGRLRGFSRAFEGLAPPDGPGCSCVPTHEVNAILRLDLTVLWDAVTMLAGTVHRPGRAP